MRARTAILALLVAFPTLASAQFLPAFEFAEQDVETWLEQVEKSDGGDHAAVWAIFYHDDRSREVVDRLAKVCRSTTDDFARCEIQTLLSHWGEADPCAPLRFERRQPEGALLLADEPLLQLLRAGSLQERIDAAVTLVSRQRYVDRAVKVLMEVCCRSEDRDAAMTWAREYAGSAWDDVVLSVLADSNSTVALRLFAVEKGRLLTPLGRENAIPLLTELGLVEPSVLPRVLRSLCCVSGASGPPEHRDLHAPHGRRPLESQQLDSALAEGLPSLIEALDHAQRLNGAQLRTVAGIALRGPRVREAIIPLFRRIMRADGPLSPEALWSLCHLGESDVEIRNRYVNLVRSLPDASPMSLWRVSCLQQHDDETLPLLEHLYRSSPVRPLAYQLGAAGLLDTDTSWIARDIVDRQLVEILDAWWTIDSCPMRAVWLPRPSDDRTRSAELLGLTVCTLRERNRNHSAEIERFLDLLRSVVAEGAGGSDGYGLLLTCLKVMAELDLDSPEIRSILLEILINVESNTDHQTAAARMLLRRTLSRHEQAVLCHLDSWIPHPEFDRLLAAQGKASIEAAGRMRMRAWSPDRLESWRVDVLDHVLPITPMSRNDEALLVTAMGGGFAYERRLALQIVRERGLDTPTLREAVLPRAFDCDREVVRAATLLADERGWSSR